MRYKLHLTETQYYTIWKTWYTNDCNYNNASEESIKYRIYLWNKQFKPKFNLSYSELVAADYDEDDEGYWGTLTGSKKAINWILLQL